MENKCYICKGDCNKKVYDEKSWIIIKNMNYIDDYHPEIHFCSYLCFVHNKNIFPTDYWKSVMNKEDFNDIRPIQNKTNKLFNYLSYEELIQLTDQQKTEYFTEKEKQIEINPIISSIYDELYLEDCKTYEYEIYENDVLNDNNMHDDY